MVFHLPLNRFVITAAAIGMFGSTGCIIAYRWGQYKFVKKPYCTMAVALMESNKAVMELIGSPVKISPPESFSNSVFEDLLTTVRLPFSGSKKMGELRIEADRLQVEDQWSIKRLEVTFKNVPNKILVVYKRTEPLQSKPKDSTLVW